MNGLINLVSAIIKTIGDRPSREFSSFVSRLGTSVAILLIACIIVFIGILFIVWAIYLSFQSILSPPLAALVSGSITIIFSILIVFILRLLNRPKEKKIVGDGNIGNINLKDFAKNITLVKDNPLLSIVLTVIAGYLIGSSSSARSAFAEVIVKVLDQRFKTKKSDD